MNKVESISPFGKTEVRKEREKSAVRLNGESVYAEDMRRKCRQQKRVSGWRKIKMKIRYEACMAEVRVK